MLTLPFPCRKHENIPVLPNAIAPQSKARILLSSAESMAQPPVSGARRALSPPSLFRQLSFSLAQSAFNAERTGITRQIASVECRPRQECLPLPFERKTSFARSSETQNVPLAPVCTPRRKASVRMLYTVGSLSLLDVLKKHALRKTGGRTLDADYLFRSFSA